MKQTRGLLCWTDWFFVYLKIDKSKIRSMNTCEVDGKSYKVGERIYPENVCYECLCTPDFDNSTSYADNSNCLKINCGMENVLD